VKTLEEVIMLKLLAPALLLFSTGAALAQTSSVPPEEFDNTRRQAGDTIQVCFDRTSLSRQFDEAVAQALGEALFLEVKVMEGFGGFPLTGDGFMDELNLAMNNDCDMFMGVSVSPNTPASESFSITRPYATIPFVLAVKNPDWQRLGDIPKDQRLGTAIASMGEMNYITWAQQRSKPERWVRLPYADPNLMTTRVLDGTIAGMILWQPVLARLQQERPEAAELHVIANDPIPASETHVGALVSARNSFLRSQIDQAIDALVADGTIDGLLKQFGYLGRAGG
jgi:polar amino acid transport system substrate-binding protein